jgi:hypothetical protein
MMQPTNSPRRSPAPTTFTTVTVGWREVGTMTGCPGSWNAHSASGDYLGKFLRPLAARRAVQHQLEAENGKRLVR